MQAMIENGEKVPLTLIMAEDKTLFQLFREGLQNCVFSLSVVSFSHCLFSKAPMIERRF